MSALARFLRVFCLTDEDLLKSVNRQHTRRFLTFHGASVLVIALLALLAGTLAVYTVSGSMMLAAVLGFVFATIILCIDTLIAGAATKRSVWARIPIAIVVGFAIAYAAELTFMSDRLDRVTQEKVDAENEALLTRLQQRRGLPDLERQLERAVDPEGTSLHKKAPRAHLRASCSVACREDSEPRPSDP